MEPRDTAVLTAKITVWLAMSLILAIGLAYILDTSWRVGVITGLTIGVLHGVRLIGQYVRFVTK